jgi:hypothetical protein
MQIPQLNIKNATGPDGDYDVLVIMGNDWANQLQGEP